MNLGKFSDLTRKAAIDPWVGVTGINDLPLIFRGISHHAFPDGAGSGEWLST